MEIGGIDIVVDGKVMPEAPDFVRRLLGHAWQNAVVCRADEPTDFVHPMILNPELWAIPSELFVFYTKYEAQFGDPGRYFHLFFSPDQITLVVNHEIPEDKTLADEIVLALRANHLVRS